MQRRHARHRIRAVAPLYPSEDQGRVETAIANVFEGPLRYHLFSIVSDSSDPNSLGLVREAIRTGAESWRVYRRSLEENRRDDDTWFYLNKQAAFVGRVAVCQEADESPLGPIKISIASADLDGIVEWLAAPAGRPGRYTGGQGAR